MEDRDLRQIGPYTVKRFIDEGGFAWVFEVSDPKFAVRRLALKMLKPEAAAGDEFRRFEDEASLLARIDHPNVVTIFDFGRDESTGCFYYTMTFVDGPTLKERLHEGPLPVDEALSIFVDILDGLDKIHQQRIVHRDIKPGNILIGSDGRARLGDLGIARIQTERGKTRTGVAVGTALYMSPEQARGKPVDARSDIFSVGLTLYEVLTGNVVYDHVDSVDATSSIDVLMYIGGLVHQKREFDVLFPREPQLPRPVQNIIRRACRLDREKRFATAGEMRAALLEVLNAPPPEPTLTTFLTKYRWPLAGLAAALVVLVLGVFRYNLRKESQYASRAHALFAQSEELDDGLRRMVERAKDLGAPAELMAHVEQRASRASQYLLDGQEDMSVEPQNWGSAAANLRRANAGFADACDQLSAGFLVEHANDIGAEAEAKVAKLRESGGGEHAAEAWTALEALLPGLATASGEGCAGANAQLARIDVGASVSAQSVLVEQQLAEVWPRLAEEAHQGAVTARRRAEVEPLGAREYRAAMKDGKQLLVSGEGRQKKGAFQAARDAFSDARRRFEEALLIAPAAKAREEANALAVEFGGQGVPLGGVSLILSEGDRLYHKGQWKEAAVAYRDALGRLRGMRRDQEVRAAATAAQTAAVGRRDGARAAGAETSAPEVFAAAQSAISDGNQALERGEYAAAEAAFEKAEAQFAAAQDAAIQSQEAARTAQSQMIEEALRLLAGKRACADLASRDARASCDRAERAKSAGTAALEQADTATARQRFATALAAYRRAFEQEWERARPRPPTLVRRTPARAFVKGSRNELRRFTIEASDPDGDSLSYSWSVDGKAQVEHGNTLQLRLGRDAKVSVRVTDGQGGELMESWSIEVGNQPPRLAVTPGDAELIVQLGESLHFRAVAADADGDALRTKFRLDGREVGGGASYIFEARQPGSHKLEVVATDVAGAQSRQVRRIVVPGQAVAGDTGSWRRGVERALDRYESALEESDLATLEQVLMMGPRSPVRAFYERKFSRGEQVVVRIDVKGSIRGDGHTATVDFDQTETSPSRTRTYRYRASMVRQGGGEWRIERCERRR
jgi:serine/threonine protein kinase